MIAISRSTWSKQANHYSDPDWLLRMRYFGWIHIHFFLSKKPWMQIWLLKKLGSAFSIGSGSCLTIKEPFFAWFVKGLLVVDWMLDFLLQYAFTEFLLVYNLDCHLLAQYTMGPQLHQTWNKQTNCQYNLRLRWEYHISSKVSEIYNIYIYIYLNWIIFYIHKLIPKNYNFVTIQKWKIKVIQ